MVSEAHREKEKPAFLCIKDNELSNPRERVEKFLLRTRRKNFVNSQPLARKLLYIIGKIRVVLFALLIMLIPTLSISKAENISQQGNGLAFHIRQKAMVRLPIAAAIDKAINKPGKPYGGTLVWGTRNKPSIINPLFTTSSVSMSLLDLIFNRLVRINAKGEIEPDLAESWDISPDGLVYTFYLRKGVRFHDGLECTASDVKFTYDTMIDPKINSPFREYFEVIKEITVINKYTLRLTIKKPSTFFLNRLTREIIPRHLLEGADLRNCPFNLHPVGTGPFKFKEWRKDNQITLEYNPDYYEGRPYLDKVMVKVYPDSRDLWTGLMRKEVHYATFIEKEDYEIIKDDPAFRGFAIPWDNYYAIYYNLDDPILSDKKTRHAIAYGIDREALIERVADGYGMHSSGPFYPDSLGVNYTILPFEYNPIKSMGLLKEVGWKDEDNDGILEKEGEELEIRILVDTRSEINQKLIMFIRQQLQSIGIKVKVVLYNDEKELSEAFLRQYIPQAQIKLFLAGIKSNLNEARIEWYSKESKRTKKLWDYRNKQVDVLFELGEVTQDRERKQTIYQKIQEFIYDDQPACFLYFPFVFHAVSAQFENVDEFFTLNMPYYTMKDWYIKEKAGKTLN